MIIILGLIILIAAVVIGVAGVLGNHGVSHALVHPFAVLGYHVTGSNGKLFLYGIVIGAIGVAGLALLLAAARRTSRRGSEARRGLRQSRQETAAVSRDRDDLIDQRETARAYMASTAGTPPNGTPPNGTPPDGTPSGDSQPGPDDSGRGGLHRFGRLLAPRQTAAGPAESPDGRAVADVPADTPAP